MLPLLRQLILLVVSLCIPVFGAASDFDPFEGPKPLAIFIQSDPWAMVLGSDTPRVAIYENGELIFVKKQGRMLAYHVVTLDEHQLEEVRAHLKPVLALGALEPRYNLRPNMSDQPEARFYIRDGERQIATSVYGLMAGDTVLPGYTQSPARTAPTDPPIELLELHQWLSKIDFASSAEWTPRYVQVMFWDYSYAPDASIHWPDEWPSLTSDRAIKRGKLHSAFLDAALLPKLRKFLATRKEKGAVEISGQKMTASYRFVFPGEREWQRALARGRPKVLDPE